MAVVQAVGPSELSTTDKPNGTLRNASPNPELQLTSTGRPTYGTPHSVNRFTISSCFPSGAPTNTRRVS